MDGLDIAGIGALGAPIEGSAASGADPRADVSPASLYYRLRDARADARAAERAAENDPTVQDNGLRHWRQVADLAIETLRGHGKDIEVASWLAEALVRLQGLAGFAAAADLMGAFVTAYWENGLFPLPDEDGAEPRIAPIAGLSGVSGDGTLLQPLRRIVLFRDAAEEDVTYWRFAQARAGAANSDAAKRAESAIRLAALEEAARGAARPDMDRVAQEARRAAASWAALEAALQEHLQGSTPPMRRVRDLLEEISKLAESFAPPAASSAAPDATSDVPQAVEPQTAPEAASAAAPAPNREAMLDEMLRIAARFRAAEPNSPLGYTIEDAVRRARMPWPALLEEMMPDAAARNALLASLGIRVAPP